MLGSSWIAAQLAASQEGLSAMQFCLSSFWQNSVRKQHTTDDQTNIYVNGTDDL
jgi:hypothetical protein